MSEAAALATAHRLSANDAAYVAAATKIGAKLVSCDIRDLVSSGFALSPAAARES